MTTWTTTNQIREGDFLWSSPAGDSVTVTDVKHRGEWVAVTGTLGKMPPRLDTVRNLYLRATDDVAVAR